jgi:hypothetical protein
VRRWWESTTGTTYIGHGNYRVVFDMGDGTVLKLALDATGEDENVNEIQAWEEHHDDEASRFLAPLLEGDERYVLMERAEPLSMSAIQRDPSLKRRLDEASRQFNNLALEGKHEIMDIASPSNWGLLNGELVLIDYPEDLQ